MIKGVFKIQIYHKYIRGGLDLPGKGQKLLFPKPKSKKKKKHHPPSILHDKKSRTCYLCIMLHDNWSEHSTLQEHHVFSGPNRTNSEENGLKIYLCRDHYVYGPEAIHNNARIRHEVQRMAQREFERQHSHKEFMKIFGRNYLDQVEIGEINEKKSKPVQGSRPERESSL